MRVFLVNTCDRCFSLSFISVSTSLCLLLVSSCSRFSSSSRRLLSSSKACRRISISRSCTRETAGIAPIIRCTRICFYTPSSASTWDGTRCSRSLCFSTWASRSKRSISSIFATLDILALLDNMLIISLIASFVPL